MLNEFDLAGRLSFNFQGKKLLPALSTMIDKTLRARVFFNGIFCLLSLFPFPRCIGRCNSSASSMNFSYRMNGQRCWKVFEYSFLFTTNLSDDFLERSYNLAYPKDLWTLTGRFFFWHKFSLILWSFLFVQLWDIQLLISNTLMWRCFASVHFI